MATQEFSRKKESFLEEVFTGADESLSIDTQRDVCDENGASNGCETGTPAVVHQQ